LTGRPAGYAVLEEPNGKGTLIMVGEPGADRTVGQLVTDASEQVSRLVRAEMRLAVAELRQKGGRLGAGAGLLGVAGMLAWYGGAALVAAAVLALALALEPWLAALVVGAAVLLIAGLLGLIGKKRVQEALPPIPEAAVDNVRRDVEAVKEGLHR
jgi:membrane protein